ncbi:MAG: metal-dependent hydrolase [Candidatus Bathyarchaeia archaeon]
MNLTTHMILAFAVGITFFHNVGIAFIITIGAMIPDLDREYFFVAKDFIARHQLHRCLFHNIFFIGVLYFINPFLALGALSHSLLDSFTSATDRGVELLYPITRIVKGYKYSIDGNEVDTSKRTVWWVEDPWTLLKVTTDRDLQEPTQQPWRRSYGPFRNSRIVDWGIFFASIGFLIIMFFGAGASFFSVADLKPLVALSFAGIAIFYIVGELYRKRLYKLKLQQKEPESVNWFVLSVLIAGLVVFAFGGWLGMFQPSLPNLTFWMYALISMIVGFILSYLMLKVWKGKDLSM